MNEQEQGVHAEGCYFCKLLYPDRREACPLCGGGLHLVAAQMLTQELVRKRIEEGVAACRAAHDPAERHLRATHLLQDLFVYGSGAVRIAAEAGLDLDDLRTEYEAGDGR